MRQKWMFLAVTIVVGWFGTAWGLDTWGRTRTPRGAYDAVVVAGCRVYADGSPSPALAWRVRTAVDLWERGVAPRLVFTGGVGTFPPSEAAAAAALAASLGVPRSAIVIEDRSTSTEENARNAADKLDAARIVVVTDAYHVFRARRVFARYFAEVDAVGSTYGKWSRVRGALREVLAIGGYAARGRL
jgi:uncharacterized SAM-binding protein YcdF (DUF218 family)